MEKNIRDNEGGGGVKGTISVISRDPPCKNNNAIFTMIHSKMWKIPL